MSDIPQAKTLIRNTRISSIWVIPLIAALVGGWMVFKGAVEENLMAEVSFKNASGLEAGKTVVKLRNIKVGDVTEVRFSKDLSQVIVVIEFTGIDKSRLTDSTHFWVVKPRVGVEGISGLDTLLSGAFIEIDPGEGGVPATVFKGLEEPQIYQLGNPGTKYVLKSDELGSLSRGSPVKFRNITVGSVTRYKLFEDHSYVEVEIFIAAPHDKYVTQASRFWNRSGVSFELGAKGFKLDLESLSSLISGGISFTNLRDPKFVDRAAEGKEFVLYDTAEPEVGEILTYGVPMKLYFENGVSGLSQGAPVEFKGLRIGTVTDIGVEANLKKSHLKTYAIIDIEPERLPKEEDYLLPKKSDRHKAVYAFFDKMIKRNLRGQLNTNIITGQSLVALDYFPNDDNEIPARVKGVYILPTVPATVSGLLKQLDNIMARVESIPMGEIGRNLNETAFSINSLIETLNINEGGSVGVQFSEVMDELTKAAKSIRTMTEYLERHPEALIKGKAEE